MKAKFKGIEFEVNSENDFQNLIYWTESSKIDSEADEFAEATESKVMQEAEEDFKEFIEEEIKSKKKKIIRTWTKQEVEFAKDAFKKGIDIKEIASNLGRSTSSVYNKLNPVRQSKLKGKSGKRPRYTEEDLDYLRNHTVTECMAHFGRARSSIYKLRDRHGIKETPVVRKRRRKSMKHKGWTKQEDEIVRQFSPKRACSLLPGRTINSIYNRRIQLGVSDKDMFRNRKPKSEVASQPMKTEKKSISAFEFLDKEQSNLYLGIVEHQARNNKILSVNDIHTIFAGLDLSQSRALLHDTFQQWQKIKETIKSSKKAKLVNDNNAIEFY